LIQVGLKVFTELLQVESFSRKARLGISDFRRRFPWWQF